MGRQLAADRLDLGELGHPPFLHELVSRQLAAAHARARARLGDLGV
jgi:hypothetical protein